MTEQLAAVPDSAIVVVHSTCDYRLVANVMSPSAQAAGEATGDDLG